jgi:hypothetical protein
VNISAKIRLQDKIFNLGSKIHQILSPRNLEKRRSSYPFLSSDTYFDICDAHITDKDSLNNFIANDGPNIKRLYILGELVKKLISQLDNLQKTKVNSIVIMESDTLQKTEEIASLLKIAKRIYSNNLVGSHENITPIPLGIERQCYRSAGRLKDFKNKIRLDANSRQINFFIAWNDETNPKRKTYKDFFRNMERSFVLDSRMNARTIHKIMRKSLFVPSPAGNGLDCHRTWEAIYLGCVPVVLKSEFCGDESWPVLVVNQWSDLLNYSQAELIKIYDRHKRTREASIKFSTRIIDEIMSA